jgi:GPH family glycoside/pentoside/hexuronide:cation symporter
MLGVVLARTGYVADAEQTAEALHGIVLLMSVLPAVIAAVGTVAFFLYPISESMLAEIKATLATRRSEEESTTA